MLTTTHSPAVNPELNLLLFRIPQSLLLQTGTASIVMLLIGTQITTKALEAIGEASGELFRGDRLPILQFPEDNGSKSNYS
ncbi:MAG: hypothetical protein HEQ35_13995 [Gloeotrichia echinulata IR180]|jgi:hypothetical protein|nr:hypothetical protein [Gloeotrichia echinulata DEX184]